MYLQSFIPYVYWQYFYLNIISHLHLFYMTKKSYMVFLIVLAITAITAELLRQYLLGDLTSIGFVNGSYWYFGDLTMRLSKNFWITMYHRLRDSGPFNFVLIYTVTTLLALSVSRSKKLLIFTIVSSGTFLIAWLTFSNVYRVHDYYELPVTIIMFISFSVSLSFVFDTLLKKHPSLVNFRANLVFFVSVLLLLSYLLKFQHYISYKSRTNFFKAVEYGLKDEHQFLFVSNNINGNPAPGGMLSTKFKPISSLADFDQNCTEAFPYKNILIEGQSICSEKLRNMASSYLKDSKYTFIKLDEKLLGL